MESGHCMFLLLWNPSFVWLGFCGLVCLLISETGSLSVGLIGPKPALHPRLASVSQQSASRVPRFQM